MVVFQEKRLWRKLAFRRIIESGFRLPGTGGLFVTIFHKKTVPGGNPAHGP